MVKAADIRQLTLINDMSQEDKLNNLIDKIKKIYNIDVLEIALVKNQTSEYKVKSSIGPARIQIFYLYATIRFNALIEFDGEQLLLKKTNPALQTVFDDINHRTMVFNAVKMKSMGCSNLHFYENTKFTLTLTGHYNSDSVKLLFKAKPYAKYTFFTFLDHTGSHGYDKHMVTTYINCTFDSITGIDEPFSYIKEHFNGRNLSLADAKRLQSLHRMVNI
jgi:hypothetical protein